MERPGRAVAALCAVQFVDVLGVTVVVTALPSILAGLHAPERSATLVVPAYAMCFGGLLMLGARLGDRVGYRRTLLAGLATFAAGSLVAALAGGVGVLVAARCLQGAGAALSVPAALRLLSAVAHDEHARRRALAGWSAAGAIAGASGFLIGGLVTDLAGWRVIFWINLPLAAALALLVWRCVPPGPRDARERLDAGGAVLLTAGVMGLVLGAALLERPGTRATGAAVVAGGAVVLAAFARLERRVHAPLLPARAARHPRLRAGAGASFANTAATSSAMTLVTLHLQNAADLTASATGVLLLPVSLGVVGGAALAAPALGRRPPRTAIAAGLAVIVAADVVLLLTAADQRVLPIAAAVMGAGLGLSSVAANTLGTQVGTALQGTASGLLNTAAQLGTALGVAALLLVASAV